MHAEFTALGLRLAEAFWPGPLTLVLKCRAESDLCDLVSAGLETIAIRAPDHPIAQALLEAAARPIAAPSANKSGRVSPTQANHVQMDLGDRVGLILDGGPTAHGLESTIIDARGEAPILLRTGAVPAETIEIVLGQTISRAEDAGDNPLSPGQLASHYAPEAKVRLGATDVQEGEALLAFGSNVPATAGPMINLSATGDLIEAAANLFAALRTLDQSGSHRIAVMPIPEQGLGEGINDRLRRAATPR